MNSFVQAAIQTPDAVTENEAATFSSSLNACVDLFFKVGASRGNCEQVAEQFERAHKENPDIAVRIALWARDIRGGAGERDAFRTILPLIPKVTLLRMIHKIVELGRWDDLSVLVTHPDEDVSTVSAGFWKSAVICENGLAAKWAPRKGDIAIKLRQLWKVSPKQYRRMIVDATKVVEQKMCANQWDSIDFSHVPSVAAARYNAAFGRHAPTEYAAYKNSLVNGETTINASAIFPHDVVRAAGDRMIGVDTDIVDVQWNSLPDFCNGKASDILVMSDVSGSMASHRVSGSVTALDVSIALGLFISERQTGPFKDLVLTFSSVPSFHKVHGKGITDRVRNLGSADWGMTTDVSRALMLILQTAIDNNVPVADLPKILIILSDMEFDACALSHRSSTPFQKAKEEFKTAGYKLPNVVFWNLASRNKNVPVRYDQSGVALVSGFSPAILKTIVSADELTPEKIMLDAVMNDRYNMSV